MGIRKLKVAVSIAGGMAIAAACLGAQSTTAVVRFAGPTSSQPIALSGNDALLAVANPDNNSVSIFRVANQQIQRLKIVQVPGEPNGVTFSPNGNRLYVTNTTKGLVSVLSVQPNTANVASIILNIQVGTEPYGIASTPNGSKLYVTNARSSNVSVISTSTNPVKIAPYSRPDSSPAGSQSPTTGMTMTMTKPCT